MQTKVTQSSETIRKQSRVGLPHKEGQMGGAKGDPSPGRDLERIWRGRAAPGGGADNYLFWEPSQGKVMDHVQGPSGELGKEQMEKGARDGTRCETSA